LRPWAAPCRRREAHGRRDRPLGSGPAYIYIIIEALAEAGVKVGLPRDIATLAGRANHLWRSQDGARDRLSSGAAQRRRDHPAGCTIDGILELEEGGLRVTLIKAVMRATQRAKELAAGC
jgi:pyrroline-5-carboxylate reductase